MPVISDTLLNVMLPSGNRALYSVAPQHVPRDDIPNSYQYPRMYGQQVAVELNGDWCRSGTLEKITDLKTLALIDRAQVQRAPQGTENA